MFSLIITIISIALVAALAVATIYYGGSAFTQGSAKAAGAALVAQAQQIAGAVVLAENDGNYTPPGTAAAPTGLTTGTTQYLTVIPTPPAASGGGAWTVVASGSGFTVQSTGTFSDQVCIGAVGASNYSTTTHSGTNGQITCAAAGFSYAD